MTQKALDPSAPNPEVVDKPQIPKLTMKYLNERINELQQENQRMVQLLADLERQWSEIHAFRLETAAAADTPFSVPLPEETEFPLHLVKLSYRHEVPQDKDKLLPRSARYPKKKKKKPAFFHFLHLLMPFRIS